MSLDEKVDVLLSSIINEESVPHVVRPSDGVDNHFRYIRTMEAAQQSLREIHGTFNWETILTGLKKINYHSTLTILKKIKNTNWRGEKFDVNKRYIMTNEELESLLFNLDRLKKETLYARK